MLTLSHSKTRSRSTSVALMLLLVLHVPSALTAQVGAREGQPPRQLESSVLPSTAGGGTSLPGETRGSGKTPQTPAASSVAPSAVGAGQASPGDIRGSGKTQPSPGSNVAPSAAGAGQVPAGGIRGSEKPLQSPAGGNVAPSPACAGEVPRADIRSSVKTPGVSSADAAVATVYDAYWTNLVDMDRDVYVRSARLNWDPDVAGGGTLAVFEKIYWKLASNNTWNLIFTASPHVINGTATGDLQYVNFNGGSHDLYDWKIEVYRSGVASPDDTRDPSNDPNLHNFTMETATEDDGATIYDANWTNLVDQEGDGYVRSARLNWDPDVVGGGALMVFEKVYWKFACCAPWNLIFTTSPHVINGISTADQQYVDVIGGSHDLYDWKIEVYRSDGASPDYTRGEYFNDADLDDFKMELATEDVTDPTATIYDANWTNLVDTDGDGYVRSARLNWDPDVVGGGELIVFERVYWKLAGSNTWNLIFTHLPHWINGNSTADQQYLDFDGRSHDLYDWKIEVYRSALIPPDYARDPSNDADLDNFMMEAAAEEGLVTSTVYDAYFSSLVDSDGDGYVRSARLNWDSDVVGSSGTLTVFEKVYWKLASSSTWTLLTTTTPHVITGISAADEQYLIINGGSHELYDWKIEVYRNGVVTPDYSRDPANDGDLDNLKMETAAEDALVPPPTCVITLNKTTFINGDSIIVQTLAVANLGTNPLPIEYKLWVNLPGGGTFLWMRGGADDSTSLQPGSTPNVLSVPFTLSPVSASLPRGAYSINCRLEGPVTGNDLVVSTTPFTVQ